ncbi:bifunctional RNase H/acid phosphatase [Actinokineospora sp. NBRC 105648]|uniref:bifunctional RNase H/acid phosphatase n=1 Tax=Actinokineospora sp. NBRC 105648 TaxID=3032206 RepID=UPI0024A4D82B|nr:bifunctional RNase H/acid phosphatase [Actinokineospora sp. NBRC 105648]GLZ40476.1 bifunctional RNase H/acid phosphatase [Actinokineospora sp. NBRC 105648]
MLVEADGGSRGNPGPAGYGAVVLAAETGAVLAERAEGIGVATNNVAEYRGLIAGLRAAAELGADTVEARMDSKLVVEQMSGRWQVKHPSMRPLADEARAIAAGFAFVSYTWIPRERNRHADRLANEAMDAQDSAKAQQVQQPQPDQPSRQTRPTQCADPEPRRSSPAGWSGAQGTPTKILLLRHGQTEMSVAKRYSGRGDVPLTEVGEGQAAAAAARIAKLDGIDAQTPIIASPLGRTRQTATAVAQVVGGQVETHDGLIETDFGQWEGMTFTETAERDPELHGKWLSDTSVPAPGGESFDAVHRRVRRARDELITRFGGRTLIVVSHVTPIKSLLRMGLDVGPSLLFRLHLDLASLSIVEFYPDGNASVRLVNDISHLG